VKPGFGEQTTLRFPKHGNKAFGAHASDLIVKFVSKEPAGGFARDGNNLVYCVNLDLIEALESKPATIKTLDGRSILLTPNEAITPQTQVVLKGEGMPAQPVGNVLADTLCELKGADGPRGDLIVRYNIAFPKKILNHHKDSIMQALAQC
jgi:DnaJ-class molecular chaperone